MVRGNRYKTLRWRFIESLEPPKVVHARCPDMVSKGNLYAQVTVRMHTKQVSPQATALNNFAPYRMCLCEHIHEESSKLWPLVQFHCQPDKPVIWPIAFSLQQCPSLSCSLQSFPHALLNHYP